MEYNLDKEMVYNEAYEDPAPFWISIGKNWSTKPINQVLAEIIHNAGYEVTLFNTCSFRQGFLRDKAGLRTELHNGLGVSCLNHFNFDWYLIISPKKSKYRNGQWGISFSFSNIFKWTEKDFRWWEAKIID